MARGLGKLDTAKTLGGLGSILELIPFVSIVGYILTLIAVKYVSDELQDRSIFNHMLYAVITAIVGVALGGVLILGFVASRTITPTAGFASFVGFLAIVWIALIISAIFIRRAFDTMAEKLKVNSFHTAGTLYLVGAALTIILVGFIILLVAYIFQIISFFSIPSSVPMTSPSGATITPPPLATGPQPGMKFCPTCGAQMPLSSTFCPSCGAKQP